MRLAAGLLRALARSEADRIWLPPAAGDADGLPELPELPGLARPGWCSGALSAIDWMGPVLAWGETEAVAELRARGGLWAEPAAASRRGASIAERLRRQAPPAPKRARQVNDRALLLDLASELGCPLPGSTMVERPAEIERWLERSRLPAEARGAWVLKAPYSAAGRERVFGRGASALREPATRGRVQALLRRFGRGLLEPWMPRVDDWACVGLVDAGGGQLLGMHRLLSDGRGRFRGIELPPAAKDASPAPPPGASPEEVAELLRVFEAAAGWLDGRGYRGPFGVDAWRYRLCEGGARLHPLGELNGRLTMGHLAHAAAEALRSAGGVRPDRGLRLRLGARPADRIDPDGALVLAGEGARAAWLEPC